MPQSITAFKIPLGPAVEPGQSPNQLAKRTREAYRIIHAIMPSTRFLTNSFLQERIVSDGGLFWLALDLAESPQMPLFNPGPHPIGQRITSSLASLYAELLRLREEAESAVIRVGELAMFASELESLPDDESRAALGELSQQDLELWRLIHRRREDALSIEFEDGEVNLPLPTLGAHLAEKCVRKIRFRVKYAGKKRAKLSDIEEITCDEVSAKTATKCPKSVKLLRSPEACPAKRDAWFLLYVAEYKNLVVDATVRMALNRVDFLPSHLELLEISNAQELQEEMAGIARHLCLPR